MGLKEQSIAAAEFLTCLFEMLEHDRAIINWFEGKITIFTSIFILLLKNISMHRKNHNQRS